MKNILMLDERREKTESIYNYGKVVNGVFFPAPRAIVIGDRPIGNPTAELLEQVGYKKVVVSETIPDLTGKRAVCTWTEKDDCIEQRVEAIDPPIAYGFLLRNNLSYTCVQLYELSLSVERVREYESLLIEKMRHMSPESGKVLDYYAPKTVNGTIDEVADLLFTTDSKGDLIPTEEGKSILSNPEIHLSENHDEFLSDFNYTMCLLSNLSSVQQWRDPFESINFRMALCYLYSLIDDFINKVIRTDLMIHPEKAVHKPDISAISELMSFTDYDELKEKLITDEINQIPFKYYEKYKYLEKELKFNQNPKRKDFRDDIILLCEERNVIIHKGGVVDKKFLNVVKTTMYSQKYAEGDSVIVTYDYIKGLINLAEEFCKSLFDTIAQNNPLYF